MFVSVVFHRIPEMFMENRHGPGEVAEADLVCEVRHGELSGFEQL